jgi:hypothetical protein
VLQSGPDAAAAECPVAGHLEGDELPACESATMSARPSSISAMPLGHGKPSATSRMLPSGWTNTIPGPPLT